MLNIWRSHDRLIFNMGIPIPGKNGLYIETAPSLLPIWVISHYLTHCLLPVLFRSHSRKITHGTFVGIVCSLFKTCFVAIFIIYCSFTFLYMNLLWYIMTRSYVVYTFYCIPHVFYRILLSERSEMTEVMMTSSNGNIFRVTGPLWGNPPVTEEFPSQRPETRSFDVSFDQRLNKRLSKQLVLRWFETPSRPLRRHCTVKPTTSICSLFMSGLGFDKQLNHYLNNVDQYQVIWVVSKTHGLIWRHWATILKTKCRHALFVPNVR